MRPTGTLKRASAPAPGPALARRRPAGGRRPAAANSAAASDASRCSCAGAAAAARAPSAPPRGRGAAASSRAAIAACSASTSWRQRTSGSAPRMHSRAAPTATLALRRPGGRACLAWCCRRLRKAVSAKPRPPSRASGARCAGRPRRLNAACRGAAACQSGAHTAGGCAAARAAGRAARLEREAVVCGHAADVALQLVAPRGRRRQARARRHRAQLVEQPAPRARVFGGRPRRPQGAGGLRRTDARMPAAPVRGARLRRERVPRGGPRLNSTG